MTWTAVTIRSLCERTGTTDPRRRPDVAFRYIDISGIDRDLKRIGTTAEIMGADAPSRARQVVKAKDVLVSTVRPNLNAVAMVPDDLDGEVASTGFCILRAMEQVLDPRFLFYFTRTDRFVNTLLQHVRGANYPAVTDRNVHDVEIPWPAKSEQQRIVEVLDQADTLRNQRRVADEKANRVLPSLFRRAFGDPLNGTSRYPMMPLDQIASTSSGGTPDRKTPGYFGGSIPWVKSGELRRPFIDDTEETLTEDGLAHSAAKWQEPGTVLVALYGATVGEVSILRIRATTNQAVCAISPGPDVDGVYIAEAIRILKPALLAQRVGGAQPNISQQIIRRMGIPLPDMSRQRSFRDAVETFRNAEARRDACRESAESLFAGLLRRAFEGELTAKWREANKAKLEAELEQQMAALGGADSDAPRRGRKRKAVN